MTRIEELCKMLSSTTDESMDDVLDLLNPSDTREEMQEQFESAIGYDPISYHDKKELGESIDALKDTDAITDDQGEYLDENREKVVDEAYDLFNESYRSDALNNALTDTLSDMAGIDYSAADEEIVDDDSDLEE